MKVIILLTTCNECSNRLLVQDNPTLFRSKLGLFTFRNGNNRVTNWFSAFPDTQFSRTKEANCSPSRSCNSWQLLHKG